MEVIVGSDIRIRDFTKEANTFFANKLTFDNPEYFKKLNAGKWTGNTPKTISLIQRDGNDLLIPFGMLPLILKNKHMFSGVYHNFDTRMGQLDYGSSIKLYDYQEGAVSAAIKHRQGVIVAPCGAGKTQIGLELAARLGGRTLWLTHTSDLLRQSMERAKSFFGLENNDYGTITAGKVDIGNVITFATVQTMSKIDLTQVRNRWDVVIVDECHHVVGSPTKIMMFYRVVSNLKARYKYGLTATPTRADGLTPCMYSLIGPQIIEIDRNSVSSTTCSVNVNIKRTDYTPNLDRVLMPDGTMSYPRFINEVTEDRQRNEQIVEDIISAGGTSLVLTDRVAHIDALKNMLSNRGVRVLSLSSASTKKAKDDRANVIYALNNKCVDVLIATYALAKEGLDVPSLDNLFMATPQKNDALVTQSAGRVARKADGKDHGTIWDYEDNFSMLKNWQKKRIAVYKKLGFAVSEP